MVRVCPRCRALSQNAFLCPRCGIQTMEVDSASGRMDAAAHASVPEPPTFGSGLLVGLLMAQGLTYAFSHLTSALLLAQGGPEGEAAFRNDFSGTVAVQSIQAVAVFVGAMVAGSCQARPLIVGIVLGLINAMLLLAFQVAMRQKLEPIAIYSQPLLHACLGALGASLGARIWQPAPGFPAIAAATGPGHEALTTILPDRPEDVVIEVIPWGRIMLGVLVATVGTFGARWIRDFVVLAGGGTTNKLPQSEFLSQFITWQIAALAQVLGGVVAGSNSRAGTLYGFWVGLLAAGFVVVVPALVNIKMQSHEVVTKLLGFTLPEGSPAAWIIQGIQTLIFGVIGGWLGSLILPFHARKRVIDGAS